MDLTFANSAFVAAPERFLRRGGRWKWVNLRVRYGVLRHPTRGVFLIDTGIGPAALQAPGRGLLLRAYGSLLRYDLQQVQQPKAILGRMGLAPADVAGVIVTHFHADHVACLDEFPNARIIAHGPAFAHIRASAALANQRHGIFPSLLPQDTAARLTDITQLPQHPLPFDLGAGADLFHDGSCLAVDLPGHAMGHFGLAFPRLTRPLLYGCDVQWLLSALVPGRAPAYPARLILDDAQAAARSAALVHQWQVSGGEVLLCHDPVFTAWDAP